MNKLKHNEQGIGQMAIILIVVVVVAVAGVGVWQLTKKKTTPPTSTSTTTSSSSNQAATTEASSACLKQFNDNTLCDFAANSNLNEVAYVATGNITSSSGTSTYTIENDGKGDYKMTYDADNQQISSVDLAGNYYVQTGNGATWLEYNSGSTSNIAAPNPVSGFNLNLSQSIPTGIKVVNDGKTSCDGSSCTKYQVEDSTDPTATEYVYIGNSDHKLAEWTATEPANKTDINLNFDYQPVTISTPSPVTKATI